MTRAICVLIVGFQFQGLDKVNHEMHEISRMISLLKTGRARLDELAEFLQTHSQASLPIDFQKTPPIRFANVPVFSVAILLSAIGFL